ncbi:MAG: hypothetical protein ACLT98_15680 [Eggerthellaceae bacterium]
MATLHHEDVPRHHHRFGNHFERWRSEREMYIPSDEFDSKSPFDYWATCATRATSTTPTTPCGSVRSNTATRKTALIRKADGDYTYSLPTAYHYWKKMRGFDH